MMDRGPNDVLADIQATITDLRKLASDYATARRELVEAELKYEKTAAGNTVQFFNSIKEEGGKLPAEDVRRAIIHTGMDTEIWAKYILAKSKADAMDRVIRVQMSVLSGLQSELAFLKHEVETPDYASS